MAADEAHQAKRARAPERLCGAKARTAGGRPCQRYKLAGKERCALHGGKSTGPPVGNKNGQKHGIYSAVLSDEERTLLLNQTPGDVGPELALARLQARRAQKAITAWMAQNPGVDAIPESLAEPLDRALSRIGALEKTQGELDVIRDKIGKSDDQGNPMITIVGGLPD